MKFALWASKRLAKYNKTILHPLFQVEALLREARYLTSNFQFLAPLSIHLEIKFISEVDKEGLSFGILSVSASFMRLTSLLL